MLLFLTYCINIITLKINSVNSFHKEILIKSYFNRDIQNRNTCLPQRGLAATSKYTLTTKSTKVHEKWGIFYPQMDTDGHR